MILNKLRLGDNVRLMREPSNPIDTLALKVLWHDKLLGYVPKGQNEVICNLFKAECSLSSTLTAIYLEDLKIYFQVSLCVEDRRRGI
jgi:hypothetical protein